MAVLERVIHEHLWELALRITGEDLGDDRLLYPEMEINLHGRTLRIPPRHRLVWIGGTEWVDGQDATPEQHQNFHTAARADLDHRSETDECFAEIVSRWEAPAA